MKVRIYNKLIRDQIPDIKKANGSTPKIRVLNSKEFSKCLDEKLLEKNQEFLQNNNVEELADIFEVLLAILDDRKISFEEFEKIRNSKLQERGAFSKRYFFHLLWNRNCIMWLSP